MTFDDEYYRQNLEYTFKGCNQYLYKWVLCSISDNYSVNKRLAKLLCVLYVGCISHKVSFEVEEMGHVAISLIITVSSVHGTMSN